MKNKKEDIDTKLVEYGVECVQTKNKMETIKKDTRSECQRALRAKERKIMKI